MTDEPRDEPRWRHRNRGTPAARPSGGPLSFIGKALVLMVLTGGVVYFAMRPAANVAPAPAEPVQPQVSKAEAKKADAIPTNEKPPEPSVEQATIKSIERQQLAVAKVKRSQVLLAFTEVEVALAGWEAEEKAWEETVTPLVTSDDGKRIAADPQLVRSYRSIIEKERPSWAARIAATDQAKIIIEPVNLAAKDPEDASLPPDSLEKSLVEIKRKAFAVAKALREDRASIEALVIGSTSTGEKTLKDAVSDQVRAEATERARQIAEARKKAEDEANQKLAEIRSMEERKLADERVKKAEQEAKLKADTARRERLTLAANDPTVKSQFAPLLTKGRFNFPARFNDDVFLQRSALPSLSRLRANGYLADLNRFGRTMAGERIGYPIDNRTNGYVPENDRKPLAKLPSSDAEWDRMEVLYRQFVELAPIWVEQGLLLK